MAALCKNLCRTRFIIRLVARLSFYARSGIMKKPTGVNQIADLGSLIISKQKNSADEIFLMAPAGGKRACCSAPQSGKWPVTPFKT